MNCLKASLSCVVFMHGLLTAPFLVECIPEDGRCLIEILGNDPCHGTWVNIQACTGSLSGSDAICLLTHEGDNCTDLMLETESGIRVCTDQVTPPLQGPHVIVFLAFPASESSLDPVKPQSRGVLPFPGSFESRVPTTLRI